MQAVWLRKQIPHCNNHAVMGCWQILDFSHNPHWQGGWKKAKQSLRQYTQPSASSLQQHAQLQTRCSKSLGSGLPDWSKLTSFDCVPWFESFLKDSGPVQDQLHKCHPSSPAKHLKGIWEITLKTEVSNSRQELMRWLLAVLHSLC